MAKSSGLGDGLWVDGVDLSGDTGSIGNVGGGPATLDVTGIDKPGFERLGGLLDGRCEHTSHWNPTGAHAVLSTLPTGSRAVAYCRGTGLGSPAAGLIGKQINYDPSRGNDGALTLAVSTQIADGTPVEWGRLATPGKRTDTTATNGAALDGLAATDFGLVAYLHVFAFTGTSCTIKLQESSDDGIGDAWADVTGGTFGAQTAVGASRIATAEQTVERYLRVVTTGTFSSCTFGVLVGRREVTES